MCREPVWGIAEANSCPGPRDRSAARVRGSRIEPFRAVDDGAGLHPRSILADHRPGFFATRVDLRRNRTPDRRIPFIIQPFLVDERGVCPLRLLSGAVRRLLSIEPGPRCFRRMRVGVMVLTRCGARRAVGDVQRLRVGFSGAGDVAEGNLSLLACALLIRRELPPRAESTIRGGDRKPWRRPTSGSAGRVDRSGD